MKNFYRFMRHFQLINCRIVAHSVNQLMCLLKGGNLKPSLGLKETNDYIQNLRKGIVTPLPMGAYEYDCCVEYLKKMRRELIKNRKNHESLVLVFDNKNRYEIVIVPLEDCLVMVAKEVGFELVDERIEEDRYQYTIASVF